MSGIFRSKNNLYLIGFMGCGKTKIGSGIAERLGLPFIDTDSQIIEESGMSIVEIFEKEGETSFRSREKELINRVSTLRGYVISLGGGTVINPDNWRKITSSGITVTLSYPPEIIASRLERKMDRPLLNAYTDEERVKHIANLMEKRQSFYLRSDVILHMNHEVEPECVVQALIGYLKGIT